VAAALLLVALATAGVPGALLDPRAWGELSAGMGQGLGSVPSVRVPYRGVEEWTRIVLVLGGGVLLVLAALLAFAPRRRGAFGFPVAAAVVLGTLYAVPAVQRDVDRPFLAGATFALALAAFLWLERVERRAAPLAGGLVAGAALLALLVAPRLDGGRPLLDYEELARSLSAAPSTRYDWNHGYGPLDWPRDGGEVLRVRARDRAYWKATNLTAFDGARWVDPGPRTGAVLDTPVRQDRPRWQQRIRVTVRALRSEQFVGANTTISISNSPRDPVITGPGLFATADRPLQRGHAYDALVYVPRPSAREMRVAGTAYPQGLRADYGSIRLASPAAVRDAGAGGRPIADRIVELPFWGEGGAPLIRHRFGGREDLGETLARSPYARTYALARRLRSRSRTPYDYVLAVERHLARGFAYSERPRVAALPLEDFLFRTKVGYCQQFSGAMALLLRMGGVPARIAAGFAPGSRDHRRREFVVRDIDAHSWVEVFLPGIGWVTRDPTPAASPARSQTTDLAPDDAGAPAAPGAGSERALDRPGDAGPAGGPVPAAADDGSGPALAAAGAGAALLALLAVALRRRRRALRAAAEGVEADLAELRRALARSGRPVPPAMTLQALARRWAGTPAEGYVAALAARRYARGTEGPTRAQRAALRRALGAGLGAAGRVRAWWALPPR
jgi:hypothetical protein